MLIAVLIICERGAMPAGCGCV